jgi:hypothetical protein
MFYFANDPNNVRANKESVMIKKLGLPKTKEDLINQVLVQIERDIQSGDLTAIEELLRFVPENRLFAFLSEEAL